MRLMLVSEHWKLNVDSKIAKKKKKDTEKIYGFTYNLIWIGKGKFYLLLREYS